jgi:hypothetical protein
LKHALATFWNTASLRLMAWEIWDWEKVQNGVLVIVYCL